MANNKRYTKNKNRYMPTYGLGSWIQDNSQGIIGGLKVAGGAALMATGAGAAVGAPLMASGASDIAGEISGDRQAAEQEKLIGEQEASFNKQQLINSRMLSNQAQPQMQFGKGGLIYSYQEGGPIGKNAANTTLQNYRPQSIKTQGYGDFNKADYGDLLKSNPLYSPTRSDSIVATENYYKGIPGPQYSTPGVGSGDRLESYMTPEGTKRFAGSETPVLAYGGKIKGMPQGKATMKHVEKFQKLYPTEMAMGRTVEYEHTKNKHLADRISADHIKDYLKKEGSPEYYTGLKEAGLTDELANGGNVKPQDNGIVDRTINKPDMTYYQSGGSTHQESPYGGIPIGNKGKVEDGEFRYGDYIFSNRF